MASDAGRPPKVRGLRRIAPTAWPSVCASVLLLGAIHIEGIDRVPAPDATEHCKRIESLAKSTIPFGVGAWLGRRIPIPQAAVALLRPNALEARSYEDVTTGETASLLFVHCSDARDLLGHYPPVCYQARGLTLIGTTAHDWTIDGTTITGMRYRFASDSPVARSEVVVDNFMVLPNGRYGRDMDAVDAVARDRTLRRVGVAEVQVVTDGSMTDERRDVVFRTLVAPMVPLLRYTAAGTGHD
jgi:hypothetical protein